ncbi:MAG: OmpA family protein [Bacteroidota bacterium]
MRRKSWTLTAFISAIAISGFCQNADPQQLSDGYYLVVSAYRPAQASMAKKFADKLSASGVSASYGLDSKRNYCYVYLNRFSDFQESLRELEKVRSTNYTDAWVRVLSGGGPVVSEAAPVAAAPVAKTAEPAKPDATIYVAIPKPGTEEAKTESTPAPVLVASNEITPVPTEVIENPKADPVYLPQTLSNTPAFLSLFNARNHRVVDGEIEVIDTERARTITKVKGNSYLTLPDPKSNSGELTLICNAFGYRKVQHQIHFKGTEADTLKDHVDLVGNFYLVKFDLVRLHKGDISVLYNVYFYNDAAVMMPQSKPELSSLLEMMQDNPGYKIRLHGHTNGNASGPIITMGPSKDFFTLTADVKKGYGSAKELSGARAETIREWLIANGVTEDRIDVKAWGGGRMLHDKHSANARKNVRVEVEVLAE